MTLQKFLHRFVPARSHRAFVLSVLLFGSVASYWTINLLLFSVVEVDGESMYPTLSDGGRHILQRWRYLIRDPQRGDIVAILDPLDEGLSVKRIIALPMEEVKFVRGEVLINGERIDEPYLIEPRMTFPAKRQLMRIQLGKMDYLVLGDNRRNSVDGRMYGPLERQRILGKIGRP